MACDIAASPFHETSAFEEDWQKAVGGASDVGGLDLLADFNASCDTNTNAFDDNATTANHSIDPHFLSSAAASPVPTDDIFDQAFTAQPFTYPDFNHSPPIKGPYFHAPEAPLFASSPLRNQLHRRSVSEPPDGFLQHHHPPPYFVGTGPPLTLTRDGHSLGQPKIQHSTGRHVKNASRGKGTRGQPYGVKSPVPLLRPQHRYDFRRERGQPVHGKEAGPTSVPQGNFVGGPPQPSQPPQEAYAPSRAFTPVPSRVAIDPVLRDGTPERKVVSIPVEELRSMITDAVRKAVEGLGAAKKVNEDGGAVCLASVEGEVDDGDEIVVASVEGRGNEDELFQASDASMEV